MKLDGDCYSQSLDKDLSLFQSNTIRLAKLGLIEHKNRRESMPNSTPAMQFPAKELAWTPPSPNAVFPPHFHRDSLYADVITKIYRMDRFPNIS